MLAEQLAKTVSGKKNLKPDLVEANRQSPGFLANPSDLAHPDLFENEIPNPDSICVSASANPNPCSTEYRGFETATRTMLFSMKYPQATNNIGNFLGIVHALALLKRDKMGIKIIYSDNLIPISWVKQKTCKTNYIRTAENSKVFEHVDRAISWLNANEFDTKILKWNTFTWGQIPALYAENKKD